jgi:glycosyltransferase involved in cell wall biosynthesis
MPKLSFVVPIYRDALLVMPFCEELQKQMRLMFGSDDISRDVEVIFVNDGSPDNSQSTLREAARIFPFVKVIQLSRNFGQHVAVSCGYRHASGEYVAMINVDMQDPPDQIPLLVQRLEEGDCDIVLGLRQHRRESWHDDLTTYLFNSLLNALTGANSPVNAASLRMMNRPFIDAYNTLSERTPFIPGLENWLGFRHAYVPVRNQPRTIGRSSYTLRKRLRMARESIIGFSDLPLRLAAAVGTIITAVGVLLVTGLIIDRIFYTHILPGFTSIFSVVVLLGGANLTFLGLVGLYVGRILREVQGRPMYVIQSFENFASPEARPTASRQIQGT